MANKLSKSISYKALQTVGFTLYSLLLIPLLIKFWGTETYGAWIAIYALYNLIQVVEFGHNTYVGNAFNAMVHTDRDGAKALLGSAFRINFLSGIIQMSVIGIIYKLGAFNYFVESDMPDKNIGIILFILFFYRLLIGSYRGLLVKILNPFGYIYKSYQFSIFERMIEFTVLVAAAFYGISLINMALLWLIFKSCYSLGILLYLKRLLPEFFPWWQKGSLSPGWQNYKKSLPYIGSSLLDRSASNGVVLLISVLLGSTFLPLFIAIRTLVNFGTKVSDIFLSPITPELINLFAKQQKERLLQLIGSYWLITGGILIIVFMFSIWVIEPIFEIWTNGRLTFRPLVYYGLILVMITQNVGSILDAFLRGINRTKLVFQTSLIRTAMILMGIYAFYTMSIKGVILAMGIAEFFRSVIWLPYWCSKELSADFKKVGMLWLNPLLIGLSVLFYFVEFRDPPIWVLLGIILAVLLLLLWQYRQMSPAVLRLLQRKYAFLGLIAKMNKNG